MADVLLMFLILVVKQSFTIKYDGNDFCKYSIKLRMFPSIPSLLVVFYSDVYIQIITDSHIVLTTNIEVLYTLCLFSP